MKRDPERLNLRDAFGAMPAQTRDALLKAAGSVKEDEPVKRAVFRTALIAACIIVATVAVAMAAGQIFGWTDFYEIFYGRTRVPQAAQEILNAASEETYVVGPVTFRVQQRYADRHTAMASVQAVMTDGSLALMTMSGQQEDPIQANGRNGEEYAERLGVDPSLTWMEAAKELRCPLYIVRAVLDLEEQYMGGEGMEDALCDENGCFVDYSMQMLDSGAVGEELPLRFFLRVAEMDPETGEEKGEALTERPELPIRVAQATETVTWALREPYTAAGLTLESVRGELTPAGLYLLTDFTAGEDADPDDFDVPKWLDADGNEYAWGLNLSYDVNVDQWPKVSMMGLISVDSIPETLILSMEDDSGTHELTLER